MHLRPEIWKCAIKTVVVQVSADITRSSSTPVACLIKIVLSTELDSVQLTTMRKVNRACWNPRAQNHKFRGKIQNYAFDQECNVQCSQCPKVCQILQSCRDSSGQVVEVQSSVKIVKSQWWVNCWALHQHITKLIDRKIRNVDIEKVLALVRKKQALPIARYADKCFSNQNNLHFNAWMRNVLQATELSQSPELGADGTTQVSSWEVPVQIHINQSQYFIHQLTR